MSSLVETRSIVLETYNKALRALISLENRKDQLQSDIFQIEEDINLETSDVVTFESLLWLLDQEISQQLENNYNEEEKIELCLTDEEE